MIQSLLQAVLQRWTLLWNCFKHLYFWETLPVPCALCITILTLLTISCTVAIMLPKLILFGATFFSSLLWRPSQLFWDVVLPSNSNVPFFFLKLYIFPRSTICMLCSIVNKMSDHCVTFLFTFYTTSPTFTVLGLQWAVVVLFKAIIFLTQLKVLESCLSCGLNVRILQGIVFLRMGLRWIYQNFSAKRKIHKRNDRPTNSGRGW